MKADFLGAHAKVRFALHEKIARNRLQGSRNVRRGRHGRKRVLFAMRSAVSRMLVHDDDSKVWYTQEELIDKVD